MCGHLVAAVPIVTILALSGAFTDAQAEFWQRRREITLFAALQLAQGVRPRDGRCGVFGLAVSCVTHGECLFLQGDFTFWSETQRCLDGAPRALFAKIEMDAGEGDAAAAAAAAAMTIPVLERIVSTLEQFVGRAAAAGCVLASLTLGPGLAHRKHLVRRRHSLWVQHPAPFDDVPMH